MRYIEHILNQFPMQQYKENIIQRLELAFVKESYYDTQAMIAIDESDPDNVRLDINVDDITRVRSRLIFQKR